MGGKLPIRIPAGGWITMDPCDLGRPFLDYQNEPLTPDLSEEERERSHPGHFESFEENDDWQNHRSLNHILWSNSAFDFSLILHGVTFQLSQTSEEV